MGLEAAWAQPVPPVPLTRVGAVVPDSILPGIRAKTVAAARAALPGRLSGVLPNGSMVHLVDRGTALQGTPLVQENVLNCIAVVTTSHVHVFHSDLLNPQRAASPALTTVPLPDTEAAAKKGQGWIESIVVRLARGQLYHTTPRRDEHLVERWNTLADAERVKIDRSPALVDVHPLGLWFEAVVLGTTGFTVKPGTSTWLIVGQHGIQLGRCGSIVVDMPYESFQQVEVGGPGLQKSGGGFAGGGLGLEGAALGMAGATMLNALTTTRTVTTLIRLQAAAGEITLAHNRLGPHELQTELAPLRQMLRLREQPAQASVPPGGLAAELERLVSLRQSGALTELEFTAAKLRLLAP